jgi:PAS domain S-box-containing protein
MDRTLRILHLEDDAADAELVAATLAQEGLACEWVRAVSRDQFLAAIDGQYDVILSDYALPGFDGVSAQKIARERRPEVPFVFVSGTMGEEVAIDRLKEGATDYVLKHRLTRLAPAVRRALEESRNRRERERAETEVRRLNAELEQRVVDRTAQLAAANRELEQRKRELAQANAFLEHLLAASPSMVFRFEPEDFRVTYVSPNIGWLLGYTPEEVIDAPGFWKSIIHPDDRDDALKCLREAMDAMVVQIEQEYRCRSKDGRYRWFFNLLRIEYGDDGRPAAVLGYALDIADRKTAEEEVRRANAFLDSIIENLPVMLFVKDARDLRFVRFNRAGEEMLGFSRAAVIGKADVDFMPAQMAERYTETDRAALAARSVLDIPEDVVPTREHGVKILHTKKIPILDAAGHPAYLLGISEDITERRAAEETARLAKLEAERANRAKSEFLSRMSHDLRTPLNAVLGFAQVLEMDPLPPEQTDSVRQILKGGRHLLELINEVLDIARIESGHLSLSPEPVDVADIVQQSAELVRPLASVRGIAVGTELDELTGCHVRADRQRVKQILLNLLGNAVKYNREGGTVTIACARAGEGRVRMSVTDTGAGIPAEKLALLFHPFERLGAEQSAIEGTGLGLAVSKGLADAMGGRIGVASEVDRGTTFWLELPETMPADVAVAPEEPAARESSRGDASGTILYIEDNRSNVRLLERLLGKRRAVTLLTAGRGDEGLEQARRTRPHLILLDLHLPDMSGEEVLRQLWSDPQTRALPVAVLSADATPAQRQRLLASGAVAYLTKPLDITQLLRLIDERLASRGPAGRSA